MGLPQDSRALDLLRRGYVDGFSAANRWRTLFYRRHNPHNDLRRQKLLRRFAKRG
jgi:hypothetical protein